MKVNDLTHTKASFIYQSIPQISGLATTLLYYSSLPIHAQKITHGP